MSEGAGGQWPRSQWHECEPPCAESDTALARRAGLGDRDAFAVLVDRHGPALYRYAVRMLGDHGDAQDAVQDALVAAWRDLDRFAGRSSVRTWLFSLTSHKAVDVRRRRLRRPIAVPDELLQSRLGPTTDEPLAGVSASALVQALDQALATLPPRQRACWLLADIEGLTRFEIAEVLHSTPEKVRGVLQRARTNLRSRMQSWR